MISIAPHLTQAL